MPPVRDEALCVRHWDWSETSQTASLFARDHGILRVLAKGSKRPKSPYSGGLELLTRAHIGVLVRPQSELALLTEWDLIESFPALRHDLRVHHAGLYVADLVHHVIHDHDPHPALYDATLECLRLLRTRADVAPALVRFQWALLSETGYRPVIDADARSGAPLAAAPSYLFAPALGGFTPDAAPPAVASNQDGWDDLPPPVPGERTGWRVRAGTLDALRRVASGEGGGLAALAEVGVTPPDPDSLDRAARLLASYLRYVLGTEPSTMPVLFGRGLAR